MALFSYPPLRDFTPAQLIPGIEPNALVHPGAANSVQVIEIPGSRWMFDAQYPEQEYPARARLQAYLNRLRGPVNQVLLWHLKQPTPRGTMRVAHLAQNLVRGDQALEIAGAVPGATLEYADMVGVGGMLFQVVEPVIVGGGGTATVQVTPPARKDVIGGTSLVFERPTSTFILQAPARVPLTHGKSPPFAATFVESWALGG